MIQKHLPVLGFLFLTSLNCSSPSSSDAGSGPAGNGVDDASSDASALLNVDSVAPADVLRQRFARFFWDANDAPELTGAFSAASTRADYLAIANLMRDDPRARDGIAAFTRWWLFLKSLDTLQKTPTTVATPPLIESMKKEAPEFVNHVIFDGDSKFETLFQANYTFADATLARHYGNNTISGDLPTMMPFEGPRAGILGEASVLYVSSSPYDPPWPMRHYWISLWVFRCIDMAGPLTQSPTVFPPNSTVALRKQVLDATSKTECSSCHSFVNPVAFAFLGFDAFGRLRNHDLDGSTLDTSGTTSGPLAGITFTDQPSFTKIASEQPEAKACFVRQLVSYAIGNRETNLTDSRVSEDELAALVASFAQADNIRELIVTVATSDLFLQLH